MIDDELVNFNTEIELVSGDEMTHYLK